MGKGGGQPTQTSSTVQNTNVPEYARPYVENMLGATQQQLFKMDGNQITGFQPYKAFGGTYDEAGNQIGYDPSKAIAGFSPLQQKAMGMANGPEGFAQNVGGYMSPYMQNVVDVQKREAERQSGIMGMQNAAQATQAGAFGGSRFGIQEAERQRNLAQQMGDIQAQGSQAAFANAQNQFNTNLGQMSAAGALQQQNQQQAINQAMQDYANAQQYPLMQLGTMSNMLRGLPMQAQTTQQYQAQANPITQGIGAIGTLGSLGSINRASGGTVKSMASGGITSVHRYDVGGEVISQLSTMPDEALKKEAMESPSPRIREMAAAILKQRQAGMEARPQDSSPMGVDYNANYAGGGIIAFARGDKVNAEEAARLAKQTEMYVAGAKLAAEQRAKDAANTPKEDLGITTAVPEDIKSRNLRAKEIVMKAMPDEIPDSYAGSRTQYLDQRQKALNAIDTNLPINEAESLRARQTAWGSRQTPVVDDRTKRSPELYKQVADSAAVAVDDRTRRSPELYRKSAAPAVVPIVAAPAAAPAAGIAAVSPPPPPPLLDRNAPAYVAPAAAIDTENAASAVAPANDPLAGIKAAALKAQAEADKTQEQRYADMQAARKAQGLDNDEARQNYMKELMAQKANLADEAHRTNMLRRAQFFAQWGSTPGNTLVAGMAALKDKIPDIIQDAKDQKLAMQQADKAIYDLGEATRLEKLGQWDKAAEQKQKAAETAANLQAHLASASASIEHAKLTSAGTVQAANIHAASAKEVQGMRDVVDKLRIDSDNATRRQATQLAAQTRSDIMAQRSEDKDKVIYQGAQSLVASVEGRIENIRNNPAYQRLVQTANLPVSDATKPMIDSANKALNEYAKSFEAQRKAADDALEAAKSRLGIPSSKNTSSVTSTADPLGLRKK